MDRKIISKICRKLPFYEILGIFNYINTLDIFNTLKSLIFICSIKFKVTSTFFITPII